MIATDHPVRETPPPLDPARVTRELERGPQRYLHTPHGEIAHWRFGRGPDVVCVHGWPLTGATWRELVPLLASSFTLHVIDLPGAGATRAIGPVGFEAHAAAVRGVIAALGLTEYALVAHDSGGLMARLAAADDDRVRGLVLGNTEIHGHHTPMIGAMAAVARLPGGVAALTTVMRVGAVRRSRFGFGGCFHDPARVDGEFGRLFVAPLLRDSEVARAQCRLLTQADFSINDRINAVHARLRAPVRCVWGADDAFFPLARARAMMPSLPAGSDLVEVADAKLFVHEERPREFAHHARAFLAGLAWRGQDSPARAGERD